MQHRALICDPTDSLYWIPAMSVWGVDRLTGFHDIIRRQSRQPGLMRAYGMAGATSDKVRLLNQHIFDAITPDWHYLDVPHSVVSFLSCI